MNGVLSVARPDRWRTADAGTIVQVATGVLAVLVLAALLAPLVAPQDPNAVDLRQALDGPSGGHLLGTDGQGRDLLSRLLWGARPSLAGPALVVVAMIAVGTTIAIVAAWAGGLVDDLISRILDVLFAIPGILLAIVAAAVFGPGFLTCVCALTIAYIPYMARLVRGPALRVRSQSYIAAYEIQGFSRLRICTRHVLPAVAPFVLGQAAIAFGYAMTDLAALSFLGLGVQAPTADWGVMVATGQQDILSGSPQESLLAGGSIAIAIVAANVVGQHVATRAEGSA